VKPAIKRVMADETTPHRDQRDVIMQRVRIGLTGLAAVFLLTLLAASILSFLGQDDNGSTKLANGAVVANGTAADETPREPLAELGVAPGGSKDTTPAPAAASAQPVATASAPAPTQPAPVPGK